jgi:hypothetical protein
MNPPALVVGYCSCNRATEMSRDQEEVLFQEKAGVPRFSAGDDQKNNNVSVTTGRP